MILLMNEIYSQPTDLTRSLRDVERGVKRLEKDRERLTDIVAPRTMIGKVTNRFTSLVVNYLPQIPYLSDFVEERLRETPMQLLEARVRSNLHDLYDSMGPILKEGSRRIERHNELQSIIANTEANPDDMETTMASLEVLRNLAEEDLRYHRDPETERYLADLLEPKTDEERAAQNQQRINEIKQFLNFSKPTIKALEVTLISTARAFDSGKGTYGLIRELRHALDILNLGTSNLTRAADLKITSFNVIAGQLEASVEAARLAAEAVTLGEQLRLGADSIRLIEAGKKATMILNRLNPPYSEGI